jgi:hypothetical protein
MKAFIAHLQERTGIYKLGFNLWSFLGVALPLAFVVVVGGALAFVLTQ